MLKELIRADGFETSYVVLTVTLCGDSAMSKDPFMFRRGVEFLKKTCRMCL